MKAQCERCKEIVVLHFRTEGAGIQIHCPSCEADYFVAGKEAANGAVAPAPAPPPPPVVVAEMVCPKCGEPQKNADACRRCGLAREKFASWDDARSDDATVAAGDVRTATTLFAACEENWVDPARHDAFIAHCQRAGAWAFAAACYRKQTARADRTGIAMARLENIRGLAEKSLAVLPRLEATAKPVASTGQKIVLLALVVALLVAGIFYLTGHFGGVARPGR